MQLQAVDFSNSAIDRRPGVPAPYGVRPGAGGREKYRDQSNESKDVRPRNGRVLLTRAQYEYRSDRIVPIFRQSGQVGLAHCAMAIIKIRCRKEVVTCTFSASPRSSRPPCSSVSFHAASIAALSVLIVRELGCARDHGRPGGDHEPYLPINHHCGHRGNRGDGQGASRHEALRLPLHARYRRRRLLVLGRIGRRGGAAR